MKFGLIDIWDAKGTILAHSLRVGDERLPKGKLVEQVDIDMLEAAGIKQIVVARLEANEMDEQRAAKDIGNRLQTDGIGVTDPLAGRVNLVANQSGILEINADAINDMNMIDEALTIATLPNLTRVSKGTLLATIKVIPYGATKVSVDEVIKHAIPNTVQLHAFQRHTVDLILTRTEQFKESLLVKGRKAISDRIAPLGLQVRNRMTVGHDAKDVSEAIKQCDASLVLILGASATSDRQDVIPAAIQLAGGEIERFGMPVDPGNLLVIGSYRDAKVVGLPGCARAPALNGVDWVLERLAASIDVTSADMAAMGVGGLLKEIPERIQPRSKTAVPTNGLNVGLLLAAGSSSRMMGEDKLLREIDGVSLLRRSVLAMLSAQVDHVFVTLKSGLQTHLDALIGLPITIVDVPDSEEGMSASIRAGMLALPIDTRTVMMGLADMPDVTNVHYDALLAAHDAPQNRLIIYPVTPTGKRGHPVLFDIQFKENLCAIKGDQGARHILQAVPELIHEIEMSDDAVTCDLDTPEAWRKWNATRTK
jgi:molybdenum cofactor cytidylyltransferase